MRLLHANGVQQSYTQQADRWAFQLMQVADLSRLDKINSTRFSNHKSSYDLPSSAKVLALLAASDADDATVQQLQLQGQQLADAMAAAADAMDSDTF